MKKAGLLVEHLQWLKREWIDLLKSDYFKFCYTVTVILLLFCYSVTVTEWTPGVGANTVTKTSPLPWGPSVLGSSACH